jgi:hypothetical protein
MVQYDKEELLLWYAACAHDEHIARMMTERGASPAMKSSVDHSLMWAAIRM